MAANTSVLSIEKWLESIDASLKKYSADFARLDFVNTNSVKYFNSTDFALFRVPVSEAHRRMIINNVAKLQTPRSKLGLEEVAKATEPPTTKQNTLQPKKLQYEECRPSEDFGDNDAEVNFSFKSPSELMLSEIQDDIDLKQAEYDSAKDYVNTLRDKYVTAAVVDRFKAQCSKCHLRDGHNRRHCPNGECPGPEYCSDLDKHPLERKMIHDASHEMNTIEKDLVALKQQLKNKKAALLETRNSFKYRIETALINTDLDRYTFYTSRGRTPRQTVINNDIFILEKHYRGRVPINLADESKKFQKIIRDFNNSHLGCSTSKSVNPEKELLKRHGIIYPDDDTNDVTLTPTGQLDNNDYSNSHGESSFQSRFSEKSFSAKKEI